MRLLLAEDEKSLSKALVRILTHSNYSVDAVYDGEEALDYLDTENYDGVILDIMMPKMDGLTVLKTIRERGNLVPVILLTAKSEIDDKVRGLDLGANDYLTKPFDPKELLQDSRLRPARKSLRRTVCSESAIFLSTRNLLSSHRRPAATASPIKSIRSWNCSCPIKIVSFLQNIFLNASGATTVKRKSIQSGSTFPTSAKS